MKKTNGNSIINNIIHLFYSTALSSALNAAALIILAYYLQSHNYGLFSVALAISMIMGYFTDAGLSDIVLREGSKKNVSTSILMSSYIKMRFLLLIITFVFGFIYIEFVYVNNQELIQTAYLLIFPMVTGVALQSIGTTYFQLIEKMEYFGYIRMVSALTLVTTISLGMLFSLHPYIISLLYGMSYMLAGIFGLVLVSKKIKIPLKSKFHKGILQNLGSFTIGGLLFVILPHLGPLVLERTISLKDVGLFAIAYRIPQALQQIPFVVAGAYYPVLFRYFNGGMPNEHLKLNITQIKIMSLIGMGMTIPFFHLSEFVIQFLFGAEWTMAATPLKILSLLLTFQAINIALADGLTSRGMQTYRMVCQLIAVISGVILYFVLSQSYGVIGAAFAGIAIEGITLLGFLLCIPNRGVIAIKAIIPYLLFFAISLGVSEYFFREIPLLAMAINLIFLSMLLFIDSELKEKIRRDVVKKIRFKRVKGKDTEGV
ncbi:oligosaccharide flippase family protein [Evansella sp. AB-P1]|uniref:oligosaccharide flippase family protein n=1 Tax=Evansella sp. AB-P1 TaxID=3037653 RepID=UPI00241D49D2|nr:oligosaccharide flippase family protein [Evansella sp. AB-P1]MDG5787890.1 oligosaccharide flippase family protein [Evansella sp. AB-P1]